MGYGDAILLPYLPIGDWKLKVIGKSSLNSSNIIWNIIIIYLEKKSRTSYFFPIMGWILATLSYINLNCESPHLQTQLKMIPVLRAFDPSLILPFQLSSSSVHLTGFSFYKFFGFLAIFIMLSPNKNNVARKIGNNVLSAFTRQKKTTTTAGRSFIEWTIWKYFYFYITVTGGFCTGFINGKLRCHFTL